MVHVTVEDHVNTRRKLAIALAAVLIGAGLGLTPPQPAAADDGLGMNCGGTNAFRCAWVDWDRPSLIQAGGVVSDQTNPNGSVAIKVSWNLRPVGSSAWQSIAGDWVTGTGTLRDETTWRGATCGWEYRAQVEWLAAGGGGWVHSGTFRRPNCP